MSKVWVNGKGPVEGSFSFEVALDETAQPPVYIIEGVFSCAHGYYEEIDSLVNERYRLDRVRVYKEVYGSDEDTILYYFRAGDYGMRDFKEEKKDG